MIPPDRPPEASTASQRGRASRAKGHRAERAVGGYLRSLGFDARTTRQALGHDGTKQAGDVVGIPGYVCEVKDRKSSAWPTWCREAAEAAASSDAGGWVVVRRQPGVTDVGEWNCKYGDPRSPGTILHATFAAFLRLLERDADSGAR